MADQYFTTQSMTFLRQLRENNNRDWFNDHKAEYEYVIRSPALQFINDMSDELAMISPHFLAHAKKVGGSLMRIHRDVRFGKDKRPYKTNIGIQFRHEQGKDVHAPGFYVHIEPEECFVGVGIWRPDSTALGKIRDAIIERDKHWLAAINDKRFKNKYKITGSSLVNAPRGYPKDHALLGDLKRKDFIAITPMEEKNITSTRFKKMVLDRFATADAYMQFLCQALELRY